MKKTLLMTTALVAVMGATNVYAEDLNLSEDRNIIQKDYVVEDNKMTNPGTVEGNVTKQGDGNLNITGGTIKIDTMYAAIEHMGNGDINIKDNANIVAKSIPDLKITDEETGELYNPISNAIVHTGNGNINIQGGNITLDNAGIFKVAGCENGGYGNMCEGTPNNVSGDINISGGNINATNGSAIKSVHDINITGGNINLISSEIGGEENTSISGEKTVLNLTNSDIDTNGELSIRSGKINLNFDASKPGYAEEADDPYNDYYGLWSDKTFSMSGGEVNMNGDNHYISSAQGVTISGGKINVNGDNALISAVNDINLSGGEINIAQGKTLNIVEAIETEPDEYEFGDTKTLNVTNSGIVNLSGTLNADVTGGNGSNINFKNNAAKIAGNVTMNNGSVMNVGLNKATIGGDITFDSGSTLKLEIADTDNHGSLKANNITGKDGAKLSLNITKQMAVGDTLTGMTLFEGNVDNKFTTELSNNRYNVSSTDGKSYDVTYTATASDVVADAGGSANNAQTAEAWDSVTSSASASVGAKAVASVLKDLSENNEQAYVAALTAVAPEVSPMVQKTQTETTNQVFGAVSTRLTGGTVSTGGEGMSSGDSIFKRGAMWVQGLFNKSKLDDTSKAKGFDADTNGIAFGAEKFVNDDVKVGVGYAYSQTDIDGFMRSTDVDTHTAILYGEYKPSNWYVNGIATYGWSDYEEKKSVAGVGVKADYDVETFGLQAMTGYDMQVKGFGLTPEAGLRYVHIKQDGYKDSADQRVSANDSDILTGVIGAKVSKSWELSNGMNIKPEARVAATYDLMNDDVNSVVTLANGSAYTVNGEALDRFGMEFGAGVTAEVNDKVELSLGYEGKFREDYQDHTGLINAKYKF